MENKSNKYRLGIMSFTLNDEFLLSHNSYRVSICVHIIMCNHSILMCTISGEIDNFLGQKNKDF